MTAISFALPEAKCALMKTRMLASAADSESEDERCAHACGLVSRTIASSEGGGATSVFTWRSEPSIEFMVKGYCRKQRSFGVQGKCKLMLGTVVGIRRPDF